VHHEIARLLRLAWHSMRVIQQHTSPPPLLLLSYQLPPFFVPLRHYRQRPILRGGLIYHVLPFPDGSNYDGIFSFNEQIKKGSLLLFKPNANTSSNITVLLKGLRRESEYVAVDLALFGI
jgi:hypothetical protein